MGNKKFRKKLLSLLLVASMLGSTYAVHAADASQERTTVESELNTKTSEVETPEATVSEAPTPDVAATAEDTVAVTEMPTAQPEAPAVEDGTANDETVNKETNNTTPAADQLEPAEGITTETNKAEPGWSQNPDGTWSYYNDDGTKKTGWLKTDYGNWYYFKPETGNSARSEVMTINGYMYVFKDNSVMATGWYQLGTSWYWANTSGSLKKGWAKSGNTWYYLNPETRVMATDSFLNLIDGIYYVDANGKMVTGWQDIKGQRYHFNSSGKASVGYQTIDSKPYFFDTTDAHMVKSGFGTDGTNTYYAGEDGVLKKGWLQVGSDWYYLDENYVVYNKGWFHQYNKNWYYLNADGKMAVGWIDVGGYRYSMADNGVMRSNRWFKDGDKWYYLNASGSMRKGWLKSGSKWFYLKDDGTMATAWQKVGSYWYYMDQEGVMQTGWLQLGSTWYYLNSSGSMRSGWQKIDKYWYYLGGADDGKMKTGWQDINGGRYYFKPNGPMAVKWREIDGKWYYFGGEDSGKMRTAWQKVDGAWYYLGTDGVMQTGWITVNGKSYYLYPSGKMAADEWIGDYYVDKNGVWIEGKEKDHSEFQTVAGGKKTIKNFLQNAMKPVGTTCYIWGGGWDTSVGGDGRRYGVNPNWETFYNRQSASYDYTQHRFEYGNGVDCSGFVGWTTYNTINTSSNQSAVVTSSSQTAGYYANTKGWANYYSSPSTFKSGDVVSMSGHVFIVLGACSDGSLVIVHSTPPAVQISGTCTPSGNYSSQAITLAKQYMNKYYPNWKFSPKNSGRSYLTNVKVARWKVDGSGIFTDPDKYQNMSAADILKDLFNE